MGTTRALALPAAGASRTYRRAFPAATGLSGASWALESLGGNPYPPIRAWADERTRRAYRTTMLFDTRLSRPFPRPLRTGEDRGGSRSCGVL
jgi:hypothetical protein